MSFILHPFRRVDMSCISEQLSGAFNLDTSEVEMKMIPLENVMHLKAQRGSFVGTFVTLWTLRCAHGSLKEKRIM